LILQTVPMDEMRSAVGPNLSGLHAMAKLIVSRPRLGCGWDMPQSFDVLIDGESVSPISLEETIVIDLAPGPHQVYARIGSGRSQAVLINSAPGATHRLAVGPYIKFQLVISCILVSGSITSVTIMTLYFIKTTALLQNSIALPAPPWWNVIFAVGMISLALPVLAYGTLIHDHTLVLVGIPGPDLEAEQIAELLRDHPSCIHFKIRHLVIAIAVVAIIFRFSLCSW
jgi:hypothetical protein